MPAPPAFPSPDPTCPGTPKEVRGRILPAAQVGATVDDRKSTVTDLAGQPAVLVLAHRERKADHWRRVFVGEVGAIPSRRPRVVIPYIKLPELDLSEGGR